MNTEHKFNLLKDVLHILEMTPITVTQSLHSEILYLLNAIAIENLDAEISGKMLTLLVEKFPSDHDIWGCFVFSDEFPVHLMNKILVAYKAIPYNERGFSTTRFYTAPAGASAEELAGYLNDAQPIQHGLTTLFLPFFGSNQTLNEGVKLQVGDHVIKILSVNETDGTFKWQFNL